MGFYADKKAVEKHLPIIICSAFIFMVLVFISR
jgi:hypothetical protein